MAEPAGVRGTRPAHPRNPRLWLLLGIVTALLLCCGATGTTAAVVLARYGPSDLPQPHRGRVFGLDQPARDGNLQFRVSTIECGADTIGDAVLGRTATGQFCLVPLTVRNLARRPAAFVDTLQHAYGPDGRRFEPDRGAGLLANADKPVFPDRIAPGQRVDWAIVYDIPRDSRVVRLRLRHAAGSPGVQIRVG